MEAGRADRLGGQGVHLGSGTGVGIHRPDVDLVGHGLGGEDMDEGGVARARNREGLDGLIGVARGLVPVRGLLGVIGGPVVVDDRRGGELIALGRLGGGGQALIGRVGTLGGCKGRHGPVPVDDEAEDLVGRVGIGMPDGVKDGLVRRAHGDGIAGPVVHGRGLGRLGPAVEGVARIVQLVPGGHVGHRVCPVGGAGQALGPLLPLGARGVCRVGHEGQLVAQVRPVEEVEDGLTVARDIAPVLGGVLGGGLVGHEGVAGDIDGVNHQVGAREGRLVRHRPVGLVVAGAGGGVVPLVVGARDVVVVDHVAHLEGREDLGQVENGAGNQSGPVSSKDISRDPVLQVGRVGNLVRLARDLARDGSAVCDLLIAGGDVALAVGGADGLVHVALKGQGIQLGYGAVAVLLVAGHRIRELLGHIVELQGCLAVAQDGGLEDLALVALVELVAIPALGRRGVNPVVMVLLGDVKSIVVEGRDRGPGRAGVGVGPGQDGIALGVHLVVLHPEVHVGKGGEDGPVGDVLVDLVRRILLGDQV